MDTRVLDVLGTRVAVHRSGGEGPAAVLLHGNSVSSRPFVRQLDGPLGARWSLYALDFPGHGMSGPAREEVYSLPGLARIVVAVARSLGLEHAVFVGWSLGGHVALEASAELPDAAGFCVFGAPPLAFPLAMNDAFHAHPALADLWTANLTAAQISVRCSAMFRPGTEPPELFLEDVRRSDPRFRVAFGRQLVSPGFADEVQIVAKLGRPLLILHGAHDQVINAGYLERLEMPSLWRGRVHTVSDAGHSPQWESAETFDALLEEFLEETAG